MKILIASGSVIDLENLTDKRGARSTSQVYAINLAREFQERGIEVDSIASLMSIKGKDGITEEDLEKRRKRYDALELGEYDHAICTEQNGFERREPYFLEIVRKHTKGAVCTIADHDLGDGDEDLVLHARRSTNHRPGRSAWIGWAADPELFRPEKSDDTLTIFVDHKYYADARVDWTERLLAEATRFAVDYEAGRYRQIKGKTRARVVFLGPSGIEESRPPHIRDEKFGDDRRLFLARVAQSELAEIYRKTDIYIVTHSETMGLSTLEAALAGALIVSPVGFVRSELLYPLDHIEFGHSVDWQYALDRVDPSYSQILATEFSWNRLADRVLNAMDRSGAQSVDAATDDRAKTLSFDLGKGLGKLLGRPSPPASAEHPNQVRSFDLEQFKTEWRLSGFKIDKSSDRHGVRLISQPGEIKRMLTKTARKEPWPRLVSMNFIVRISQCPGLFVHIKNNKRDDSDCRIWLDLSEGRCARSVSKGGFADLYASLVPLGEGRFACSVTVVSDHSPLVRCEICVQKDFQMLLDAAAMELTFEHIEFRIIEEQEFLQTPWTEA